MSEYEDKIAAIDKTIEWFQRQTDDSRYVTGASGALTVFVWQIELRTGSVELSLLFSALALVLSAIVYFFRWHQEGKARSVQIRMTAKSVDEEQAYASVDSINTTEIFSKWLGRIAKFSLVLSIMILAIERFSYLCWRI